MAQNKRKKRLTMTDVLDGALDGALGKMGSLAQAAVHAKTLPFERPGSSSVPETSPTSVPENTVEPRGTTRQYNQEVRPDVPNGTTIQFIRSNQMVQPFGTTDRSNQMVQPLGTTETEPNLLKTKARALTKQQQRVLDYLTRQGPHITDKSIISEALGIAPFTVRNILIRLTRIGLIERHRVGQGVRVAVLKNSAHQSLGTTERYNHSVVPKGTTEWYDQSPLKIDRKKNLSISLETMQTTWPRLAATGFGPEQLDQIMENLTAVGKATDRVLQGLDHLEYELANGQLLDRMGKPVADPCSWAFRALAQNGYYRRPKGYISPSEQALHDQEEEARAISLAQQQAEQAQFEAWRKALTPEALCQAMKGYIGGPKDAWLKRVWKEKNASN